jgi:TonB family protein
MRCIKTILFITSFCFSMLAFSQNKTDTVYTFYDWQWKAITTGNPSYFSAVWPEKGKWHRQDYYYPANKLQMDGIYQDKACKIGDGVFTWYETNGMMYDSVLYTAGKKEGIQKSWNRDGYQTSVEKWKNGLPVDSAFWFSVPDGKITAYRITDEKGNGIYRSLLADGKGTANEGRYAGGKKTGKWIYRDGNNIIGVEAFFSNDSVKSITCFNEKGEPETNKTDCEIERAAKFKGGLDAWRSYLEKNLRYPASAEKKKVEGVVRVQFIIDKEGNVSEVQAIEPPDADLAAEALRIIKKSGKWEPAVQYNRKVIYRHIQSVTFRLE